MRLLETHIREYLWPPQVKCIVSSIAPIRSLVPASPLPPSRPIFWYEDIFAIKPKSWLTHSWNRQANWPMPKPKYTPLHTDPVVFAFHQGGLQNPSFEFLFDLDMDSATMLVIAETERIHDLVCGVANNATSSFCTDNLEFSCLTGEKQYRKTNKRAGRLNDPEFVSNMLKIMVARIESRVPKYEQLQDAAKRNTAVVGAEQLLKYINFRRKGVDLGPVIPGEHQSTYWTFRVKHRC